MPLPNSRNTGIESPSSNGFHTPTHVLTETTTIREPLAESQCVLPQISPFPLTSLPGPIRQFVEEAAPSFPVPPEMLALPALVSAGTAIGNSRVVQLKETWLEIPSLYGAVICDSGTMKSPAMALATGPLRNEQTSSLRTWTSDATVESIARILQQSPRGIMLYRDELSAWVRSMNQYRTGRGADKEFYLSLWGGQSFTVDRVSLQERPIQLHNPFLSVVGAIPPDMLGELEASAGQADGFLPRILYAWPERLTPSWSASTVSSSTQAAYEEVFRALLGLAFDPAQGSRRLPLTPEAQERFIEWHDQHLAEAPGRATTPFLDGCYSKLKGYGARLALIHALVSDPTASTIGIATVNAAIALVDYFKSQAFRVDGFFSFGKSDPVEKCKVSIRRRLSACRRMNKRDLQRSGHWRAEHFNEALQQMSRAEVISRGDTVVWNL